MRELLDLLFPARCAGCGAPGARSCARCVRPLRVEARLTRPTPAPAGLPAISTVAVYEGPTRAMVVAYKERGAVGLAVVLASALARAVAHMLARCGTRAAVLVPVPSSRAGRRARGCDVVASLAGAAASRLRDQSYDVRVVRALAHGRRVRDSAGLDARARQVNIAGSMRVHRGVRWSASMPVVLVDDVVTSGASLAEASRALAASGAVIVGAATVAATPRRRTNPGDPCGRM